jgi:hypothetical protein
VIAHGPDVFDAFLGEIGRGEALVRDLRSNDSAIGAIQGARYGKRENSDRHECLEEGKTS